MKHNNQKPKQYNFIYRNFLISLIDLKKIKIYFWFSFLLFFFISIIGLALPIFFEEEIMKLIESLINQTEGLGPLELIRFITVNNMQSAFLGVILGIFLAVFPIAIIVVNAYILGFVANKTIAVESILILWRLLPHGIFEIPAILIAVSLGIKLGIELMTDCITHYNKKISNLSLSLLILVSIIFLPISFLIYAIISLTNRSLWKKFSNNLKSSFRIFILIVVPLLVIAGIIEGLLIFLLT